MRRKKALIFGTGSVGRGFLGLELHRSGYELAFAGINHAVLNNIKRDGGYEVNIADYGERVFVPVNEAIHVESKRDLYRLIQEVYIIVTAVGPKKLNDVARILGEPLYDRAKNSNLLNIIACENMADNSSNLKNLIISRIGQKKAEVINANIGFPNCVIDRISTLEDGILRVEEAHGWVIEDKAWKGEEHTPNIKYVQEIEPFMRIKLYTLCGAHVTIGFAGQFRGITYVHEALENKEILHIVKGQLQEAYEGVCSEYGLNRQEQQEYINRILQRLQNKNIKDTTSRLTREKIRKLKRDERLIGSALSALKSGAEPVNISQGIAYLLGHFDPNDPDSRELHDYLQQNGVKNTLSKYSGLDRQNPLDESLFNLVEERYARVVTIGK